MEVKRDDYTTQFSTESLLNDINYGVILSFIDKFGKFLVLKEFIFDNFESSLVNRSEPSQFLKDFLWCLIRNTSYGKNLKKEKFNFALKKFVQKIFGDEILFNDFSQIDLQTKLTILIKLVELQFDENPKFKQVSNENSDDECGLRFKAIGRDINGSNYWLFVDFYFNIRLFTQYSIDIQGYSWKLISKNIQQIRDLIENLLTEPALEKLNESECYQKNLNKKPKKKKLGRPRKLISESESESNNLEMEYDVNILTEEDEESRCTKCCEIKENFLLIICDSCDLRFHVDCLKPQIEEIPDGEWYCPICEHSFLIRNLEKKLDQIEMDKKEREEKQNLKIKQDKENHLKKLEKEREFLLNKVEDTLSLMETKENDKRSRRAKSKISYTFEDFDRQIKEATGINNGDSDQEDGDSVVSFKNSENSESSELLASVKDNSEISDFEFDIKKNYMSYDESEAESNQSIKKPHKKKILKIKKKIQQDVLSTEDTDNEQNVRFENRIKKFKFLHNRFKRTIHQSDDDEYTAYNEDDYFNQNVNQENF